jgi:hypothetical protein
MGAALMAGVRRVIAKLAILGLALGTTLAVASPANAALAGPYHVSNHDTFQCLAIPDGSLANGAPAIQWSCLGGDDDKVWAFDFWGWHDNAEVYRVRNIKSGKCLAIGDSDTSNGAKAIQFTCGSGAEQRWKYDSQKRLRNMNSGRCLAIPNGSTVLGTRAIQWTCQAGSTNPEQVWTATPT